MVGWLYKQKIIFVGNRAFVYDYLVETGFEVLPIPFKDSFLDKKLFEKKFNYTTFDSGFQINQILDEIENFDILITNGCPFKISSEILSKYKEKTLVNVHPSFLPQLRGADPQIGSILYGLDSGATIHRLSNQIDGGDIIYQTKIPYSEDLDVSLLYQIGFKLEVDVVKKAIELNWRPQNIQNISIDDIYYTFNENDLKIDFSVEPIDVCRKIRALNNSSKGAYCKSKMNNQIFKVFYSEVITNNFILNHYKFGNPGLVVLSYPGHALVRAGSGLVKLIFNQNSNYQFSIDDELNA